MSTSVIWDWNGTLVDDVHSCIEAINDLLGPRGMESMTVTRYLQLFTFPVRDYYLSMGFDLEREEFAAIAEEFHRSYERTVARATLHPDAVSALAGLRERGCDQFVLSALEQTRLEGELERYSIRGFFAAVYGLDDLHAGGKGGRGRELMREFALDPESTWMIGDTTHDAEVAREIGVKCVLVARGHNPKDRLQAAGAPVVETLTEAVAAVGA